MVPIVKLVPVGDKLLGNLLQVGWIERSPDLKTGHLYRITEAGRIAFRIPVPIGREPRPRLWIVLVRYKLERGSVTESLRAWRNGRNGLAFGGVTRTSPIVLTTSPGSTTSQ